MRDPVVYRTSSELLIENDKPNDKQANRRRFFLYSFIQFNSMSPMNLMIKYTSNSQLKSAINSVVRKIRWIGILILIPDPWYFSLSLIYVSLLHNDNLSHGSMIDKFLIAPSHYHDGQSLWKRIHWESFSLPLSESLTFSFFWEIKIKRILSNLTLKLALIPKSGPLVANGFWYFFFFLFFIILFIFHVA